MNVWVFLDIFHHFTWICLIGTMLVLSLTFVLAEFALKSESEENLAFFDALCMVVFNVTQLGHDYKVWPSIVNVECTFISWKLG